jgi:hypothetical protein
MQGLEATARSIGRGLDEEWSSSDLVRLLAQAVDDFDALPDQASREAFIAEPGLIGDAAWDAALAALAVHLCQRGGFDRTPDWTRASERYNLRIAWLTLPPESTMQAFVYQRTPIYFKARGVMLDEANLVSV